MEPEGPCRKQKPTATQLWPWRYAKIEGKSLNFYESETDTAEARGSSIEDVTGCIIGRGRESFWFDTSPGNYHKITLTRKGHANGLPDMEPDGVAQVCFADDKEADCERFASALINVAARRLWNVSEADTAIAAAAPRSSYQTAPTMSDPQSNWAPIPEPQPEPQPEPDSFTATPGPKLQLQQPEAECSKEKPKMGTWPIRYIKIEGQSLNFYDKDKKDGTLTGPRGSSIKDVAGVKVLTEGADGVERFYTSTQTTWFKITLERRAHPTLQDLDDDGFSRFCFRSEHDRDDFSAALKHLAEGRKWDGGVASMRSFRMPGAADPEVEWMFGDAGLALTRTIAQMNPMRWSSGTASSVALELLDTDSKQRPIDLRLKDPEGDREIHSFDDQAAAKRWLAQLQEPTIAPDLRPSPTVDFSPPPEPEPEPHDPESRIPEPEPEPEPDGSEPEPSPSMSDEIPGRSRVEIRHILGLKMREETALVAEIESIAEGKTDVPLLKLGACFSHILSLFATVLGEFRDV